MDVSAAARAAAREQGMADEPKAKRHGSAKVGTGAAPAPDAARLIARRGRLLDALKRATGERADSLRAELVTIDASIADLQKLLAAALSGEVAEAEE